MLMFLIWFHYSDKTCNILEPVYLFLFLKLLLLLLHIPQIHFTLNYMFWVFFVFVFSFLFWNHMVSVKKDDNKAERNVNMMGGYNV